MINERAAVTQSRRSRFKLGSARLGFNSCLSCCCRAVASTSYYISDPTSTPIALPIDWMSSERESNAQADESQPGMEVGLNARGMQILLSQNSQLEQVLRPPILPFLTVYSPMLPRRSPVSAPSWRNCPRVC